MKKLLATLAMLTLAFAPAHGANPTPLAMQIDRTANGGTGPFQICANVLSSAAGCQSIGTMSQGGIYAPPSGAVTTNALDAILQQKIADTQSLRSFGYIGDGNSHPLSSVASLGSVNTTGYTLAQWQTLLSAAMALTDELDWASTQSYINAATKPTAIRFPTGRALMNHPLSVCSQSVSFYGLGGAAAGLAPVSIAFSAGTDGIDHCANGNTKVEIHDLEIDSLVTGGTFVGFNDLAAQFTMFDNVVFNGWNNGASFTNPGGTNLSKVRFNSGLPGGVAANNGTCVKFAGANSFINHASNVTCQTYYLGFWYHSTNNISNALGIEDVQVKDSACGDCRTAIQIDSVDTRYGPFNYSFENMSVDATTQFIYAPNGNNILVTGGNWLIDAPNGAWGAQVGGAGPGSDSPQNLFDVGTSGSAMARLRDMWIGDAVPVRFNSLLTAEANAKDVQFTGNRIETVNQTVGNYIQVANGAAQVIEKDTTWVNFFSPIAPPANAIGNFSTSPTNRLYSSGMGVPTLSGCGTSPTLNAGSDNSEGVIVEGSGSPTGCTLNFAAPLRGVAPICIFQPSQNAYPVTVASITTSSATLAHTGTSLVIEYRCRPY